MGLGVAFPIATTAGVGIPDPDVAAAALGGAAAQDAATPEAGQLLVVEIVLNGIAKGEFTVVAAADGDFLLGQSDLAVLGVHGPYGASMPAEGEPHYSLRGLQASEIRFDEARLTLLVTLPPERLPTKSLDLLPSRPQRVLETSDNSAFFNYRALSSGDDRGGRSALSLTTELGVSLGGFLLRSESAHSRGAGPGRDLRYSTNLTHDNRRTLQRWIVGDFTTSSGDLGGVLTLGGLSFSKAYQIDPYFIRQPMAGFTANVPSPAQAEIYVDGVRVRTENLQPGQFELSNLNYYGGQREVSVVLRDQFGGEQRLVYPYYFSDVNLRQGLHEYSYNLGAQRRELGTASNDYGALAFSAFHRYGVNDHLTLGARGEGERGRFNFGPTLALRSDRLGQLSASLSTGRSPSGSAWAGVARYSYLARRFSGQAELRRYSPHYEAVGQFATPERPRSEISAGASYGLRAIGNLSLDWRRTRQYDGADRRVVSLGYSRNLSGSISLLASASRSWGNLPEPADNHVFVALTFNPSRDLSASVFHDQRGDASSDVLQVGNNTPIGEGLGYRLVGERSDDGIGNSYRLAPSLQYNGPHGIYTLDLRSDRPALGPSQTSYQLGLGGGIALVGGALSFSRPVTDSFGLVDVGDVEGVRVYQSAEQIGRTDSRGRVFLPNLGSYVANRVAIDDRDIPVEYSIENTELNVSPGLRSGALIRFDVKRVQAITGRLVVDVQGKPQAAEYIDLAVTVDGREIPSPTGRDGEFYLENLPPGRHTVRFTLSGRKCEFDLTVPSTQDMLVELGVVHACQFDQ